LEGEETGDPTNTLSGTPLVNHFYARIFFDYGATQGFLNSYEKRLITFSTPEGARMEFKGNDCQKIH